jgi:hypothetical protein
VKKTKGRAAAILRNQGYGYKELAEMFGQPESSIRRLIAESKDSDVKPSGKPVAIIIPDTQVCPDENLDHLKWIGQYIAERKPDAVIHLGDHWDMPSLSSYEKRGSRWFEGKRYLADIQAGNKGLELIEEGLDGFSPTTKWLLRGNHEFRIERAVSEDPKLDGVIGYHDFNDVSLGWTPFDFLKPVEYGGVYFSHYWYAPGTGRPYSGTIENQLRAIGHSFTAGHTQGLKWGRRELATGQVQIGLVAGSAYRHNEAYRGYQATSEWRGIVVKFELEDGSYDPMMVSLNYLERRYG